MPQIYDVGQTALLPSEGRRAEDFFALKNPTASARFESANLSTKGQHATPKPTQPLLRHVTSCPPGTQANNLIQNPTPCFACVLFIAF
jgi:hypothetical protein